MPRQAYGVDVACGSGELLGLPTDLPHDIGHLLDQQDAELACLHSPLTLPLHYLAPVWKQPIHAALLSLCANVCWGKWRPHRVLSGGTQQKHDALVVSRCVYAYLPTTLLVILHTHIIL